MGEKTFFGYKEVDTSEKAGMVKGVFTSVASRYDIMNDAMSMGVHRLWKDRLIAKMNPKPNTRLLDVAGGTGDIAFRFLNKQPSSSVVVCDINEAMLRCGQDNAVDRGILNGIEFVAGDAQQLAFPDNHFDYYTIAFGIRNVTHIDQALKEAYRVLKPGGRFLCLEFSKVNHKLLAHLYDNYSFHVIPKMGKLLAGDADSYQYLVESIRQFPPQQKFADMIKAAGFERVTYENLTFGVVAIHSGYKAA
jgi:ubiquinone/menaquinone biosynthesis methyltransferase